MNNADQGVQFQWIAPSSICIILHIHQKLNSINDLLFIQNIHRALKKMDFGYVSPKDKLSKLIDLIPFEAFVVFLLSYKFRFLFHQNFQS